MEPQDPHLSDECGDLCARLGLYRSPALLLQEGEGTPFLTGVFRPAIILPHSFWDDCTAEQRRLILAHELAHIRWGDLLWAWVPLLGRCLFFFLPPVWFTEREWQQSQEMACDEQVLRLAAVTRSEYGDLLLKVARQPRTSLPSGLVAVCVAGSYATVRRRLLTMKHSGKTRRTLVAAGALVALVGAAVIVPWRVSAQDAEKSSKGLASSQAGTCCSTRTRSMY